MGYTHYWRRAPVLDEERFARIVRDCRRVLPVLAAFGVALAGPLGDGMPVMTEELLAVNGRRACGHLRRALGIAWPASGARGVVTGGVEVGLAGSWFGGRQLVARSCGGDCSHESFVLPRVCPVDERVRLEDGLVFGCCKTAFKPYDLAVQACLVVAAHHLGRALVVSSDGSSADWEDARLLCEEVLGYGRDFCLD